MSYDEEDLSLIMATVLDQSSIDKATVDVAETAEHGRDLCVPLDLLL